MTMQFLPLFLKIDHILIHARALNYIRRRKKKLFYGCIEFLRISQIILHIYYSIELIEMHTEVVQFARFLIHHFEQFSFKICLI